MHTTQTYGGRAKDGTIKKNDTAGPNRPRIREFTVIFPSALAGQANGMEGTVDDKEHRGYRG